MRKISSIALYLSLFCWPFLTLWLFYLGKIEYSLIFMSLLILVRLLFAFGRKRQEDRADDLSDIAHHDDSKLQQYDYLKHNLASNVLDDKTQNEETRSHALILKKAQHFKANFSRITALTSLIAILIVLSLYLFVDKETAVFYYPVCISLCFFIVFATSLIFKPSIITMIAYLTVKDMDEREVIYTTRLTMIWCCYFIVNALIASTFIYLNNEELWALYSGGISYVLMGILLFGERLFRPYLRNLIA